MNDIQTQAIKSAITQIASALGAEVLMLPVDALKSGVRAELSGQGNMWGLRFFGLLDRRSVSRDGTLGRPGELVLAVSGCVRHPRLNSLESLGHYHLKPGLDAELCFYLRDGQDMVTPVVELAEEARREANKLHGIWEISEKILKRHAA